MTTREKAEAALDAFSALRAEIAAEYSLLENSRRLTHSQQSRRQHLRETLRQIDVGLYRGDGTDPRLDALVRSERITVLRLARPGIAAVQRLIERLKAEEAEAQNAKSAQPWPRRFRLSSEVPLRNVRGNKEGTSTKPQPFALGDRDVLPGEEVALTEAQAAAFADLFEAVESV